VPPERGWILDVDQFETGDRPRDCPRVLPVEIGLRVARVVVHGDLLLDPPNAGLRQQVLSVCEPVGLLLAQFGPRVSRTAWPLRSAERTSYTESPDVRVVP